MLPQKQKRECRSTKHVICINHGQMFNSQNPMCSLLVFISVSEQNSCDAGASALEWEVKMLACNKMDARPMVVL